MADQAIKGQGKDTDIQKGGRQSPEGAGQSGKFQPLLSLTDQQRRNGKTNSRAEAKSNGLGKVEVLMERYQYGAQKSGIKGSHRQHLPNTVLDLWEKAPYDEVYDGIDNANAQDKNQRL